MARLLSSLVQLRQQFLRSVRLDADYGRTDALSGFVVQPSARAALDSLAKHVNETQQRAFTWTGPYGGGKSSLALALASLVHPDKGIQDAAKHVLGIRRGDPLLKAFDAVPGDGWAVLNVVGRRSQVNAEIALAIDRLPHRKRQSEPLVRRKVIAELVALAESPSRRGILLIIDELGKFLEASAQSGGDIYFFQELAEAACRCRGKLVVIGVLHQAFEQYASRLGREARDEWSKVQGRYIDISLAAGSDELIDLIGHAIDSAGLPHPETKTLAEVVASSIADRRPGTSKDLAVRLDSCWPLHPVTAVLLGPSSRRRFGQNERSIFGFLNSIEAMGFRDFLESRHVEPFSYYEPWQFWDYLRANLEPAILASPDGHRWALGVEAVERTESKGERLHVSLVKTIALIELFRNGSGLVADQPALASCFPLEPASAITVALDDLNRWSVAIFRKHLSAWGVYAGSDFDIESATAKAREEIDKDDLHLVDGIGELGPVVAKRVYQKTGALRLVKRTIMRCELVEDYLKSRKAQVNSCGEFILIIPGQQHSLKASHSLAMAWAISHERDGLVFGIPREGLRIAETARELIALERVFVTRTELESDKVAARELDARISALRSEMEELLRDSFMSAKWYWGETVFTPAEAKSLATIASLVVSARYPAAPKLLSELINRDAPSSNAVKARRDLMHRMLKQSSLENLGYGTFSADAGMYYSLLKGTALHRQEDERWGFKPPLNSGHSRSLKPLWKAADNKIKQTESAISLAALYDVWSAPPYGVKDGVLPILALAYFLSNQNCLAVYHDGAFVPELTDVHLDEWLQDESRIIWKYFELDQSRQDYLAQVSSSLSRYLGQNVAPEPLETARGLVSLVVNLPEWTKRTSNLTLRTRQVLQLLLRATDPHKVLFLDIPALFGDADNASIATSLAVCVDELSNAFSEMLKSVEAKVIQALDHHGAPEDLRRRGQIVSGISGDFRLDAFALRISEYRGHKEDVEALISLAVSRPEREWTDRDVQLAFIQLGTWAMEFRRVETLASMRDRPATRRAFAVVFGLGDGKSSVSQTFDVSLKDMSKVKDLASQLLAHSGQVNRELFLAALAEAGAEILDSTPRRE